MRIYNKNTLTRYGRLYPDAAKPLRQWHDEVEVANWTNPAELKAKYGNASFVGNNRVIFNVGGNKYRLIVQVLYEYHTVFVLFFGTHEQYDEIDAETIGR